MTGPLTPHPSPLAGKTAAAVFLDRDGTINVEKDYLYRPEEFEFIPGAPEAIRGLREAGYLVLVVTNQAGVARGYFTLREVERLHAHIQAELGRYGTRVDGFYVCPHHPSAGTGPWRRDCECRKPRPGLLLQAAAERGIDLSSSVMIGDKAADVRAGLAAGCRSLLVLTGYGRKEKHRLRDGEAEVVSDLAAAARLIVEEKPQVAGGKID